MAKCSVCEARKGKRKCLKSGEMICSLCCGQTRTAEACKGCSFFKGPAPRNYGKLPYFEVREMSKYTDLQDLSELLEQAIVQVDRKMDGGMKILWSQLCWNVCWINIILARKFPLLTNVRGRLQQCSLRLLPMNWSTSRMTNWLRCWGRFADR